MFVTRLLGGALAALILCAVLLIGVPLLAGRTSGAGEPFSAATAEPVLHRSK